MLMFIDEELDREAIAVIESYEKKLKEEESKGPDVTRVLVTLTSPLDTRTNSVRVREVGLLA